MSYIGHASDVEQEKHLSDFHHHHNNRISSKLVTITKMSAQKAQKSRWNHHPNKANNDDDTSSEISDAEHFLAKGAFLLTPSYDLSMERAASICEKLSFKGCFSLTKTATGILFKFSHPEDYQQVFRKGFYKVTGARFYKKVAVPCRPQKTFTLYVLDVPDELPVEDIRHALYKFNSVVEVVRLIVQNTPMIRHLTGGGSGNVSAGSDKNEDGTTTPTKDLLPKSDPILKSTEHPPPLIRVTLASLDEFNILLQNGLNFYDATFFPTEANLPITSGKIVYKRSYRSGHLVSTFHNLDDVDETPKRIPTSLLPKRIPSARSASSLCYN